MEQIAIPLNSEAKLQQHSWGSIVMLRHGVRAHILAAQTFGFRGVKMDDHQKIPNNNGWLNMGYVIWNDILCFGAFSYFDTCFF